MARVNLLCVNPGPFSGSNFWAIFGTCRDLIFWLSGSYFGVDLGCCGGYLEVADHCRVFIFWVAPESVSSMLGICVR